MCNFKKVFIAPHKNQRKIHTIGIDFTGSLYFKLGRIPNNNTLWNFYVLLCNSVIQEAHVSSMTLKL